VDILERVKTIQTGQGLNDTQMSELLGYKTREGWARIKGGIVPATEIFQMRALRAFPELATVPGKKGKLKDIFDKIVLRVKKFV